MNGRTVSTSSGRPTMAACNASEGETLILLIGGMACSWSRCISTTSLWLHLSDTVCWRTSVVPQNMHRNTFLENKFCRASEILMKSYANATRTIFGKVIERLAPNTLTPPWSQSQALCRDMHHSRTSAHSDREASILLVSSEQADRRRWWTKRQLAKKQLIVRHYLYPSSFSFK